MYYDAGRSCSVAHRVQTMIAYVPITRPTPPSPLRQLAYQENSPLLGPEADPQGWEQLTPFVVRGTVFSKREVEMACVVSSTLRCPRVCIYERPSSHSPNP